MPSRFRKFFSYFKPYKRLLIADLLCAMVVATITLAFPLCVRYITNTILEKGADNALSQIYIVGLIMLSLVIIYAFCNFFIDYQGHMMGALIERDMRSELFEHYQKLSFNFFDNENVGQLMNRITNDTFALGELYHHGPEDVVLTFLKFFGTFFILLTINVPLTLILFLLLPLMGAYAFHFNKKLKLSERHSKERIGDINAQVEDTLAGIRVVKSFANETIEQSKFNIENNHFLDSRRNVYRSDSYLYNGIVAFTQLFTVAIVIFGGANIVKGSMDLADMVTYLLYTGILIEPIRTALNFSRLYQEGITGFDRFMDILEIQPDIQDSHDAFELKSTRGEITFKSVSFKYKENLDYVLKDVSLDINAGEFVALVGVSGVGKTTLSSLIPRFYETTEGNIFIDGQNIKTVQLKSLRKHIGIVQQDVYLFSGTIKENIAYGNPKADMNDIIAAAKQANAHEFILNLAKGYDTDIGQRGVKLSGGQKQRLSIARVFLKNPSIIIFDEATSSLDNASEKAVQSSLERLSTSRTTLVIAHRLSTIRYADRIIVFEGNGIVEQGSHDYLVSLDGVYKKLLDA